MAHQHEEPAAYRVVYVGTGRRRVGLLRWEHERQWRIRLAGEMEQTCQDMAKEGLRLHSVVPVVTGGDWKGGSTVGAWLYFAAV